MKKILALVAVATAAFLVSCSNSGSLSPVTTTDRDEAMQAMTDVGNAYSGSYGFSFHPNQTDFSDGVAGSYAIITIALSNYADATTGYTISGPLTFKMTDVSPNGTGPLLWSFSGTLNFLGSGPIRTAMFNATIDLTSLFSPIYTGTVTLNGTTFRY